jgi:hypothetical protein
MLELLLIEFTSAMTRSVLVRALMIVDLSHACYYSVFLNIERSLELVPVYISLIFEEEKVL